VTGAVSIIIPTRNRAAILARCLDSVVGNASTTDWSEIIVVDDCSTDQTPQVVQEFAQKSKIPIQWLRQQEPLGANAARNRGVNTALSNILIFIDDDVIAPVGWLERLLEGLSTSGCPIVSGAVHLTAEGPVLGKHRDEIGAHLSEILVAPRGTNGEIVPVACNMAAFRWVFELARFDETLRPPVEEGDWLLRVGLPAAFIPEAWVWHYKTATELRLGRVLKGAWSRGSEGGWWLRARLKVPSSDRLPLAFRSLRTCGRALGHATIHRCWGGIVIGLGELARALALVGIIKRGKRLPKSWR